MIVTVKIIVLVLIVFVFEGCKHIPVGAIFSLLVLF